MFLLLKTTEMSKNKIKPNPKNCINVSTSSLKIVHKYTQFQQSQEERNLSFWVARPSFISCSVYSSASVENVAILTEYSKADDRVSVCGTDRDSSTFKSASQHKDQ